MNNDTERNSDAEIVERLERLKSRMAPDNGSKSHVASAMRYNPYRIGAALALSDVMGKTRAGAARSCCLQDTVLECRQPVPQDGHKLPCSG